MRLSELLISILIISLVTTSSLFVCSTFYKSMSNSIDIIKEDSKHLHIDYELRIWIKSLYKGYLYNTDIDFDKQITDYKQFLEHKFNIDIIYIEKMYNKYEDFSGLIINWQYKSNKYETKELFI